MAAERSWAAASRPKPAVRGAHRRRFPAREASRKRHISAAGTGVGSGGGGRRAQAAARGAGPAPLTPTTRRARTPPPPRRPGQGVGAEAAHPPLRGPGNELLLVRRAGGLV